MQAYCMLLTKNSSSHGFPAAAGAGAPGGPDSLHVRRGRPAPSKRHIGCRRPWRSDAIFSIRDLILHQVDDFKPGPAPTKKQQFLHKPRNQAIFSICMFSEQSARPIDVNGKSKKSICCVAANQSCHVIKLSFMHADSTIDVLCRPSVRRRFGAMQHRNR